MTADVMLDDIVERSTQRYLVTGVLNMWEVSMGGSHTWLPKFLTCGRFPWEAHTICFTSIHLH
jgi:hypothetical protein